MHALHSFILTDISYTKNQLGVVIALAILTPKARKLDD